MTGCDHSDVAEEVHALDPNQVESDREAAIAESLEYTPSPERFEYTGRIDDESAAWRHEATRGLRLTAEAEPEDDRMDVLTRDGRTFRQRVGTTVHYESRRSHIEGEPRPGFDLGVDTDREAKEQGFRQSVGTPDDRTIVTSASEQEVTVRLANTATSTGGICSASMISPRVFLTAAHCVTDGNGNWSTNLPQVVMPAVRGKTFSGDDTILDSDDTPFGARQIIRYIKPVPWDGGSGSGPTTARFDYALLVIGDLAPDATGPVQWDPTPASFATESCTDIVGDNVNVRGYPGPNNDCADAWPEDGDKCGGYAFTENAPVQQCFTDALLSCHDGSGGQSGGPLYKWNAATGERTVLGVIRGALGGNHFFHRIRPASYNVLCNVVTNPDNQSSYFDNVSC
ncbi:MAG: hypothetical protein AAF799_30670 [Myxococcota bacterium]